MTPDVGVFDGRGRLVKVITRCEMAELMTDADADSRFKAGIRFAVLWDVRFPTIWAGYGSGGWSPSTPSITPTGASDGIAVAIAGNIATSNPPISCSTRRAHAVAIGGTARGPCIPNPSQSGPCSGIGRS